MDLEAGSAAYRMRTTEQEIERDMKAQALKNREPGAVAEWGLSKLLRFFLVYLPIGAGVLWLLWSLVTT